MRLSFAFLTILSVASTGYAEDVITRFTYDSTDCSGNPTGKEEQPSGACQIWDRDYVAADDNKVYILEFDSDDTCGGKVASFDSKELNGCSPVSGGSQKWMLTTGSGNQSSEANASSARTSSTRSVNLTFPSLSNSVVIIRFTYDSTDCSGNPTGKEEQPSGACQIWDRDYVAADDNKVYILEFDSDDTCGGKVASFDSKELNGCSPVSGGSQMWMLTTGSGNQSSEATASSARSTSPSYMI